MVSIKAEDCHCMTVIGYKLTVTCYQLSEESILDSRFTDHSFRLRAPCSTLPALRCSPVVPWSRSLPLTSHFFGPLLHAPCSMLSIGLVVLLAMIPSSIMIHALYPVLLTSDFCPLTSGNWAPYRKIIPGNRRAFQNRGSKVRGCASRRNSQPTKNRSAHIGMMI